MRFPEHSFRLCPRDCAPVKSPSELQASPWVSWRCYLDHKPAPQLSLSHKRTHIGLQHSSQTRVADSSAVVELRCFLYHVCQWAISLTIFFFFFWTTTAKCQEKRTVCEPCFGLPAESHSNHFYTHWFPAELNLNQRDFAKFPLLHSC